MLGWLKRRRVAPARFRDVWRPLVQRRVALWAQLDDGEAAAAEDLVGWLMASRHWEAARGFALEEHMAVTIAANAALLALGLGTGAFRDVSAIVVHPTTVTLAGERAGPAPGTVSDGPLPLVGQAAGARGPVLLAWDAVLEGGARPEVGENVVHHELAHKVDFLDGYGDGVPPLGRSTSREHWERAWSTALEAVRRPSGHPVLRRYAGVNRAELFAVATEAFLNRPLELRHHEATLYALLAEVYQQDPAGRARRAPTAGPAPEQPGRSPQPDVGDDGPVVAG